MPPKLINKEQPVTPEVVIVKHIRVRDGLWEHLAQGKMSPNDFCVFCTLLKWARWNTGICVTSAASIAANWGDQMKVNTVQVCLGRLRDKGYIKYPEGTGARGVYPVLINKYEPQVGFCAGWRLNADASTDFENPVYDYVSETSYRAAYGDVAMDDAVRVWCISGDPYSGAEGKWIIRQPLKALLGESAVTSTVSQRSISGESAVSHTVGQPLQTLNGETGQTGQALRSMEDFNYVRHANSSKTLKEPVEPEEPRLLRKLEEQNPSVGVGVPVKSTDEIPVNFLEEVPAMDEVEKRYVDEKAEEFAYNWRLLMAWNPDPIYKGESEWVGVFRELLIRYTKDTEHMVAYSQSKPQQIYNRQPQSLLKNADKVHFHMVKARKNDNVPFYGDWNIIWSDYENIINGLEPSYGEKEVTVPDDDDELA